MKYFRVRLRGRAPYLAEAESEESLRHNLVHSKDKILLITEVPSLECALVKQLMTPKPQTILAQMSDEEVAAWKVFRQALGRLCKAKDADPELVHLYSELKVVLQK